MKRWEGFGDDAARVYLEITLLAIFWKNLGIVKEVFGFKVVSRKLDEK